MDRKTKAGRLDFQRFVDWVDDHIVNRPGKVMLVFLVATLVFAAGLGNVSTESGTQQFSEDIPANKALERIQEEFGTSFSESPGSTQLIQRGQNVLSKPELLRMLRAQHRLQQQEDMYVSSTSSAAQLVARNLNPDATTLDRQITAVERATPTDVDRAVRDLSDDPRFTGTLSNDFNGRDASASATIGVVTHDLPMDVGSSGAGQGGSSPLTPIQLRADRVVDTVGGDIVVFGSGKISHEFQQVIGDSLLIVTPAAVIFIVFFLIVAYRDLVDLLLGAFALLMAIVWTFGFLGLAGIPFNQMMIAVPPLLLAVGIDFGIHAINRYREDRQETDDIGDAMQKATDQLLVAFFIVTGTTVIGFLSNLASDLAPIRDFGFVAAAGIAFTFHIFGIFMPAAKVWIDRRRERYPIPTFSQKPLGSEGSRLGRVLRGGVIIADKGPRIFLALMVLLSVGAGVYATGVSTTFTQEDFLPPEESPDYLQSLPEPFRPSDYSVVKQLNFLEDKFVSSQGGSAIIYLEGRMEEETILEEIHRAGEDPPGSFVSENRRAESSSLVTVIQSRAETDPEFRRLVARNDEDGNGVPDDNLGEIYDYLEESSSRSQLREYLAEDRRSAKVVYQTEADAGNDEITADARQVADRFRTTATATGQTVVFQAVSDLILQSAIVSLALALAGTVVFLVVIYWLLEDLASIAFANLVPIVVTVALLAGTMRLVGIAFNAFTATILALTIGLGIDYSVHIVHRFIDEREEHDRFTALDRTVRGTGGALTGSMLTTTFGIGVLVLAVLGVLGQFGLLTALSIGYSFLASLLILPSALVIWDSAVGNDPDVPMARHGEAAESRAPAGEALDTPEEPLAADNAVVPPEPDRGESGDDTADLFGTDTNGGADLFGSDRPAFGDGESGARDGESGADGSDDGDGGFGADADGFTPDDDPDGGATDRSASDADAPDSGDPDPDRDRDGTGDRS
jgi:predicted RND superfamily exporter protein